jgi:hypothetical protein
MSAAAAALTSAVSAAATAAVAAIYDLVAVQHRRRLRDFQHSARAHSELA